jgi:hypothetical protein
MLPVALAQLAVAVVLVASTLPRPAAAAVRQELVSDWWKISNSSEAGMDQ